MKEIDIESSPYKKRRVLLTARYADKRVGVFDYLPPIKPGGVFDLGLLIIMPGYEGMGFAKALLSEFVRRNGSGVKITAFITHEETYDYFENRRPSLLSNRKRTVIITSFEELNQIPIVRVLSSGNINVVRFRAVYKPEESCALGHGSIYSLSLMGITR